MPIRRLFMVLCLSVAAGCGGDADREIKTYRVVKPTDAPAAPPAAAAPSDSGGPYRILGAMFPADNPQWFFKLVGKADELAAVEKEFDTFLTGVKFPGGLTNPPAYDLPAGWTSAGKSGMRADTVTLGASGKLNISVMAAVGGVDGNLKRWASDQLGVEPDKGKQTREITPAGGVKGLRVDITGPKNPGAGGPMMMMPK